MGGKAANLSRLAADYRVPPGFCLVPEVRSQIVVGLEYGGKESEPSEIPGDLLSLVTNAYTGLESICGSRSPSVAVRSSAFDEDGQSSSFAGQYDTYLNIVGSEAVCHAVMRCWSSASGERAQSYRQEHNLNSEDAGVAVLVQLLIPAESGGVVFSANPINGSRDEIMINASWGLGESVVSGSVTPDTFLIRKTDSSVIDSFVGPKDKMTVLVEQGTEEIDVPAAKRQSLCLNDVQVLELAALATGLEAKMGWPVDLEFAYRGSDLFLLQCRPITTL